MLSPRDPNQQKTFLCANGRRSGDQLALRVSCGWAWQARPARLSGMFRTLKHQPHAVLRAPSPPNLKAATPRRQHAILHILIPPLLEFRCRQPLPICCARQGSVLQNDPTLWLCRGDQSGLGQLGARRVPTETQQSSPPPVEYSDPDSTSNRRLGRCAAGISAILHGSLS